MKSFLILFVTFSAVLVQFCKAQGHPNTWAHNQRSQYQNSRENTNEVLVNTDRLMSSLESRLSTLFRSEIDDLKNQISQADQVNRRLETKLNSIQSELAGLKTDLHSIRDEYNPDQDLSHVKSDSPKGNSVDQKLDNMNLLLSTIRGTVGKLERDVLIVKKGMRTLNAIRHGQSQVALLQHLDGSDNEIEGVCTPISSTLGVKKVRKNFFASCDSETDEGGWILVQHRFDGSIDFMRPWNDYKEGFGNIAGEFWMGLEKIYELTSSRLHELMIVMENFDGEKKFAKYSAFAISGEASSYELSLLGKYSGDAGDSLSYQAGMKFSTFDNDNDGWSDGNCARSHQGGYWYDSCDESNLNGKYFPFGNVPTASNYQGVYWKTFGSSLNSLKSVKMMIRPVDD